ncbi:hypothetical protein VE23_17885 [Paenibacillus sp. D9]|nr:hypothetical protein VE23_17885 [Paenibacillus sp. D9]CDN42611.1 hypothetical protein BN871_BO_00130 [Paenibacillus sp. P22]
MPNAADESNPALKQAAAAGSDRPHSSRPRKRDSGISAARRTSARWLLRPPFAAIPILQNPADAAAT